MHKKKYSKNNEDKFLNELHEATPELVNHHSQWKLSSDGPFINTGGGNNFPRIDIFPVGNKEGIKLGWNWDWNEPEEEAKLKKLLAEYRSHGFKREIEACRGIFRYCEYSETIKWLKRHHKKLCEDYLDIQSSSSNKIYILAAARNLNAAQCGIPDHQTGQAGLWVNIGQAIDVEKRKKDDDYRKKNAGGEWYTIATYRAPCFKDTDIHRYLKGMHNKVFHDKGSLNTEEFFFIGDDDGRKACEIVAGIIKNDLKQEVTYDQNHYPRQIALKPKQQSVVSTPPPPAQVATSAHSGSEGHSAHSALEGCIDKNKQAETLEELKAIQRSLSELKSMQPSGAQLAGIKSAIIGEMTQIKELLNTQQANIPADRIYRDNRLIEARDIIRQDIAQHRCSLPDPTPPAQAPGAQWTLLSLVMTLLGVLLGASVSLLP
jgi:hypothetical protein